jgi:streptomycin 6-kinase
VKAPAGEVVHPGYRAFVARIGGEEGREWLATVPDRLTAAAASWGLALGAELPGGLLACVVAVTMPEGREAVLKVPSPWARGEDEVQALRAWAGRGAPELLAHDPQLGVILLERIRPGQHAEDLTAETVARLLEALWVHPYAGAPALGEIVARRIGSAESEGRSTPQRLAWARNALHGLEAAAPPAVLLHGDFDERNLLLCGRREVCAIDPLACAGDPLYDAAYWIHGTGRPGRRARFDALAAALTLDEHACARLRDWCGIVAVHG